MQTLIIYDNNGKIFTQISGDYIKPVGLQYIETEIPQGKILVGVDVSVTPHQAILEDIPPSEIDLLRIEMAQANAELFEMVLMSGGNF